MLYSISRYCAFILTYFLRTSCMYIQKQHSGFVLITNFIISAVDEQNARTSSDIAQSIVTAATTAVSDVQIPNIVIEDNRYEHRKSLSGKKNFFGNFFRNLRSEILLKTCGNMNHIFFPTSSLLIINDLWQRLIPVTI